MTPALIKLCQFAYECGRADARLANASFDSDWRIQQRIEVMANYVPEIPLVAAAPEMQRVLQKCFDYLSSIMVEDRTEEQLQLLNAVYDVLNASMRWQKEESK